MKLAASIVIVALSLASASAKQNGTGQNCGYERWAVKTGQDAGAGQTKTPAMSSIAALSLLKSPLPKQNGKYPPQINKRFGPHEFETVTVTATIVRYRSEHDSDIHMVLSDGKRTMISEIPCPCCLDNLAGKPGMSQSPWKDRIAAVRSAFLLKTGYAPVQWATGDQYGPPFIKCNIPVTITGVIFFDWPHKQSGEAGNAVEIHPVLDIKFP